jgi:hypothetical protein
MQYAHSNVVSSPCVHIQLPVLSQRRRTRLIESNAKCCHLKNLTYKRTLQQVFICLRHRTSYPPPYTPYTCIHYTYSLTEGGWGGRVKPERRGEGQQFTKLGRKYQHDWLYLQSINSGKHLPQSHLTDKFFRRQHFALVFMWLISPCAKVSKCANKSSVRHGYHPKRTPLFSNPEPIVIDVLLHLADANSNSIRST